MIPILLQMRDWGVAYEKGQMNGAVVAEGCESLDKPMVAPMYQKIILE